LEAKLELTPHLMEQRCRRRFKKPIAQCMDVEAGTTDNARKLPPMPDCRDQGERISSKFPSTIALVGITDIYAMVQNSLSFLHGWLCCPNIQVPVNLARIR